MPTFIKTTGPKDGSAKIMFLGEAPGEDEDRRGLPFVGRAGKTFDKLLASANIDRHRCIITNVAREKPPGNNILHYFQDKKGFFPKPILVEWLALLREEILTYNPNIIVALGNTALWALTDERGIGKKRGTIGTTSLVPGQKFLATYHPQKVNYDWTMSFTVALDLRKAAKHAEFPETPEENRNFIVKPTLSEWEEYCNFLLERNLPFAVDIETSRRTGHITRIGFSHEPDFAMSLKILSGDTPNFPENDEIRVWDIISEVLEKIPTIYHNATYDTGVLWHHHRIHCKTHMDTMIAGKNLWPEAPKSLAYYTSICLDYPEWKSLSVVDQGIYNCYDVANTMALAIIFEGEGGVFSQRMKNPLNKDLYTVYQSDVAQVELATFMQLRGIYVDNEKRESIKKECKEEILSIEEKLRVITGKDINYKSHTQVKNLLYIDLGLPVQFQKRRSVNEDKKITSDEKALTKLCKKTSNPIPPLILKHRNLTKQVDSFLQIETSPESRVHTSYNITGSKFSRWSSSKSIILPYGSGNLQNIPHSSRVFYTAKPGYSIVGADYVQAEAVVTAYLSYDRSLIQLFEESFGMSPSERKKSHDVHRYTASQMFEILMKEISAEQRRVGKTLRHAMNYVGGPGVVAEQLDIPLAKAKSLRDLYLDKNKPLVNWHKRVKEEVRQNRVLINCFGRPHRFLGPWGDELIRSAISFNPQSTIGDLLNKAFVRIYDAYGAIYTAWLQLHDGLYLEVKDEEIYDCIKSIRPLMLIPFIAGKEEVVVDVDFKVGKNWKEMEEVDIDWRKEKC